MLSKEEYERKLHRGFPMTALMGAKVESFSRELVQLSAPLEPNCNPHQTAFGGSQAALLIACGWSRVYELMYAVDSQIDILILSSSVDYLLPVEGTLVANSFCPTKEELHKFYQDWQDKKRAKINLSAAVVFAGKDCARFTGRYMVIQRNE